MVRTRRQDRLLILIEDPSSEMNKWYFQLNSQTISILHSGFYNIYIIAYLYINIFKRLSGGLTIINIYLIPMLYKCIFDFQLKHPQHIYIYIYIHKKINFIMYHFLQQHTLLCVTNMEQDCFRWLRTLFLRNFSFLFFYFYYI